MQKKKKKKKKRKEAHTKHNCRHVVLIYDRIPGFSHSHLVCRQKKVWIGKGTDKSPSNSSPERPFLFPILPGCFHWTAAAISDPTLWLDVRWYGLNHRPTEYEPFCGSLPTVEAAVKMRPLNAFAEFKIWMYDRRVARAPKSLSCAFLQHLDHKICTKPRSPHLRLRARRQNIGWGSIYRCWHAQCREGEWSLSHVQHTHRPLPERERERDWVRERASGLVVTTADFFFFFFGFVLFIYFVWACKRVHRISLSKTTRLTGHIVALKRNGHVTDIEETPADEFSL